MMTRRDFLKTSANAGLAALFLNHDFAFAEASLKNIGLQLYTVQELMRTDPIGTLEKVAKVGYKEVEFAGYYNIQPKEWKKVLDRLGLKSPSTHISLEDLHEKLDEAIETAKTIGHQYAVFPSIPESERTLKKYKAYAAIFNKVGEAFQKAGIQFAYHNHDFEFETIENQIPFDVLLAETDPNLVQIELDLFWITKAGKDPITYFKKYPGRYPLCHVKDMDNQRRMVDVGKGVIDFKKILANGKQAGLKYFFVEFDEPPNALQTITTSFQYLSALKF